MPTIFFGNRDEVDQPSRRNEVMDEMARGPSRFAFFIQDSDASVDSRDQAAIGDAAGEARLFRTEQGVAHGRVNAVGADNSVGRDRRAILEMGFDLSPRSTRWVKRCPRCIRSAGTASAKARCRSPRWSVSTARRTWSRRRRRAAREATYGHHPNAAGRTSPA